MEFSTLGSWERGRIEPPLSKLRLWAGALGVALDVIATTPGVITFDSEQLSEDRRALLLTLLGDINRIEDREARMLRAQIEMLTEGRVAP